MPDRVFTDPPENVPIPDPEYRRRVQWRFLILYLINVVALVMVASYLSLQDVKIEQRSREFQEAVIANCVKIQENTRGFNEFIEKVQIRVGETRGMTAQEREQTIAFYEEAKQEIAECPPK